MRSQIVLLLATVFLTTFCLAFPGVDNVQGIVRRGTTAKSSTTPVKTPVKTPPPTSKTQSPTPKVSATTSKVPSTSSYVPTTAKTSSKVVITTTKSTTTCLSTTKSTTKAPSTTSCTLYKLGLRRWLLESPSLVVADEAHKLKNAKSKITKLAHRFQTSSRIALTGSPLNNHLEEYHTMVEWIAPNYLGNLAEFRQKYVDPINEGLYADSSNYERRRCLKKLHVLKKDLEPKVNRADITAIKDDMPPMTEYIITIALTDMQREAYDKYVSKILGDHDNRGSASSKGLFKWMSNLIVLANHPSAFMEVYVAHEAQHQAAYESSTDTEDQTVQESQQMLADLTENYDPLSADKVSASDFNAEKAAAKVFEDYLSFGKLEDPELSVRTSLTMKILQKAIAAGDKTLVFSHSIPTLNYLEMMVRPLDRHMMRIDGGTKVADRQKKTKDFNTSGGTDAKVILISTKAGGLGLNIQGANRVILFDSGFNPMWEEQAVGRAYRLGQKRAVFVYRFKCGGTFEDPIYDKALFKTQLFQRVVDKKNPTRATPKSVSKYLFPVKDVKKRDYSQYQGRDPKVLDAILEEVNNVYNLELMETFSKDDGETLDAEELKAADEEYQVERLRRENPEEYRKKMERDRLSGVALPDVSQLPNGKAATGKTATQRVGVAPSSSVMEARLDRLRNVELLKHSSHDPAESWSFEGIKAGKPAKDRAGDNADAREKQDFAWPVRSAGGVEVESSEGEDTDVATSRVNAHGCKNQ